MHCDGIRVVVSSSCVCLLSPGSKISQQQYAGKKVGRVRGLGARGGCYRHPELTEEEISVHTCSPQLCYSLLPPAFPPQIGWCCGFLLFFFFFNQIFFFFFPPIPPPSWEGSKGRKGERERERKRKKDLWVSNTTYSNSQADTAAALADSSDLAAPRENKRQITLQLVVIESRSS